MTVSSLIMPRRARHSRPFHTAIDGDPMECAPGITCIRVQFRHSVKVVGSQAVPGFCRQSATALPCQRQIDGVIYKHKHTESDRNKIFLAIPYPAGEAA